MTGIKVFSNQQPQLNWGTETLPFFDVSYFEAAASDLRRKGKGSDDFFAYHDNFDNFSLVVCDGVGQSANSGMAARLIGMAILEQASTNVGIKEITHNLIKQKRIISKKIDLIMETSGKNSDPFLIRAWNEFGAEVQFGFLNINLNTKNINFYRVGNIHLVISKHNGHTVFKTNDNGQFWTTKKKENELHLEHFSIPISEVNRVILASDGVSDFIHEMIQSSFKDLRKIVFKVIHSNQDDIAGVEIRIRKNRARRMLKSFQRNPQLTNGILHWEKIRGADFYRISEIGSGLPRTWTVGKNILHWKIPAQFAEGEYCLQALSRSALSSPISTVRSHTPQKAFEAYRFSWRKKKKTLVGIFLGSVIVIFFGLFLLLRVQNNPQFSEPSRSPLASMIFEEAGLMTMTEEISSLNTLPTRQSTETPMLVTPSPTIGITSQLTTGTGVQFADELTALTDCQRRNYTSGYVFYYVKQGDTFYELGEKYNIDYKYLMTINCYQNPRALDINDVLIIPISNP